MAAGQVGEGSRTLHRDLMRGPLHNFKGGSGDEFGGGADGLLRHGSIVRTGYDKRRRRNLREQALGVMAFDRRDSAEARKSVVAGQSVSVRVDLGGRGIL